VQPGVQDRLELQEGGQTKEECRDGTRDNRVAQSTCQPAVIAERGTSRSILQHIPLSHQPSDTTNAVFVGSVYGVARGYHHIVGFEVWPRWHIVHAKSKWAGKPKPRGCRTSNGPGETSLSAASTLICLSLRTLISFQLLHLLPSLLSFARP
jgi:hypothetical protein